MKGLSKAQDQRLLKNHRSPRLRFGSVLNVSIWTSSASRTSVEMETGASLTLVTMMTSPLALLKSLSKTSRDYRKKNRSPLAKTNGCVTNARQRMKWQRASNLATVGSVRLKMKWSRTWSRQSQATQTRSRSILIITQSLKTSLHRSRRCSTNHRPTKPHKFVAPPKCKVNNPAE